MKLIEPWTKPCYFPLYWLFSLLIIIPKSLGSIIPPKTLNKQVFFIAQLILNTVHQHLCTLRVPLKHPTELFSILWCERQFHGSKKGPKTNLPCLYTCDSCFNTSKLSKSQTKTKSMKWRPLEQTRETMMLLWLQDVLEVSAIPSQSVTCSPWTNIFANVPVTGHVTSHKYGTSPYSPRSRVAISI